MNIFNISGNFVSGSHQNFGIARVAGLSIFLRYLNHIVNGCFHRERIFKFGSNIVYSVVNIVVPV